MRVKDILFHLKKFPKKGALVKQALDEQFKPAPKPKAKKADEE